ncbi:MULTISPECIES: cytochrome P450 [unclassified Nocardia]|uniref:cytochrome P450 family protein n=1 Tax=unclassified Nocardia TaxID=2637762 RepID=UPI001CE4ABB6|nr:MULTISPECIES: cytochrome P450 [unclassified Nocardia]
MDIETTNPIETLDDDFYADPQAHYRRWRERGPVVRFHAPEGVVSWLILGHDEARAALRDPRLRKNVDGTAEIFRRQCPAAPESSSLLNLDNHMGNCDPPEHTRLRKLVNKAFTPRAVAAMRPHIEATTNALLDEIAGCDEVDLLAAFAVPLPVRMICGILGVPRTDLGEFQRWAREMFTIAGERRRAAIEEKRGYIRDLVRAKRARPGPDLLSALVHAREDNDRLTEKELVSMAFLLLFAGHGTTADFLTTGSLTLLRDETLLRTVRDDPFKLPGVIEELLRFDGPIHLSAIRFTAEPVRFGDIEIPAGEFVHIALSAANHDPACFSDPDRLDITRDAGRHLGFGHGAHFCAGANLARMEATVAFSTLLRRFPDLRLARPAAELTWHHEFGFPTLTELPVRLG